MEYLKIGLIKKTHGLKGELKILPLTDEPSRYRSIKNIFIERDGFFDKYTIKSIRETPSDIIIKLSSIESIEEAESLKNCYIYIDRAEGLPLNEWEYYSEDIVGCEVLYNNELMGVVIDLVNFGANDNLVIEKRIIERMEPSNREWTTEPSIIECSKKEIFFPFSRLYIDKIDLVFKRIHINQWEGFFD